MNQFLSNEVAYELNFEYSTLFESLVSELLFPDGTRHNSLEYEFEDTNPDYSTITEFADPDNNYAESELFENDTIIDDPRSFEFSEDTDRGWLFRKIREHSKRRSRLARIGGIEKDYDIFSGYTTDNHINQSTFATQLVKNPYGNTNDYLTLAMSATSSESQNSNIFNKFNNLKNIVVNQSVNNKGMS